MTTLVGKQHDFVKALQELIELDFDAVEAYEAAINRMETTAYTDKLKEFKSDHQRHIQELSDLLKQHGFEPPNGPSAKQWLTKGKVVLANLVGEHTILKAMHSNEIDTNTAYERMVERQDMWQDAKDVLDRGVEDEHRHRMWLESIH